MHKFIMALLFVVLLSACGILAPKQPLAPVENPTPIPTLTPTGFPVLADSFFFGHAFVDVNGNGQLDESDPPLAHAIFMAKDASGANGGGLTDSEGNAMAWWPSVSTYPVIVKMRPPEDSGYTIIGESEIVLQAYETSANFLFAPPE